MLCSNPAGTSLRTVRPWGQTCVYNRCEWGQVTEAGCTFLKNCKIVQGSLRQSEINSSVLQGWIYMFVPRRRWTARCICLLTATRHIAPLPWASEHLLVGLSRVWVKLSSTEFRSNLESLLVFLLWFLVERHSFYYTGKSGSDNTHRCYFYRIKAQVPFAISDFSSY